MRMGKEISKKDIGPKNPKYLTRNGGHFLPSPAIPHFFIRQRSMESIDGNLA
jgi:hypothetical protein